MTIYKTKPIHLQLETIDHRPSYRPHNEACPFHYSTYFNHKYHFLALCTKVAMVASYFSSGS
ncbi:hypothetical protein [Aquibacillus sediminis]|uniref:hypothetical protein n=1 Tax=Aquibacillus sediminis TaxID=2574734 RepID=UPI001108D9B5|nr:hypothetical protein [Aquibacillus sediminis]